MSEQSSFSNYHLPNFLTQALSKLGIVTPTPIQKEAIPIIFEERDLMGSAPTGSGKTAAFLIPIITLLEKRPQANALILVPTRELAEQIQEVAEKLFSYNRKIGTVLLIGGVSMGMQNRILRLKRRIIIATPGRLLDHLNRGTIRLNQVERFVLDEADRMLDMGFFPQVMQVIKHLPEQRQSLLFSATFPPQVKELAKKLLRQPHEIAIREKLQISTLVTHDSIRVENKLRAQVALDLLKNKDGPILVFTKTKRQADGLFHFLGTRGVSVSRIHGGRTQADRKRAIAGLRQRKVNVLIATDLASRGIDIPDVSLVLNYELPSTTEDYIHRVGRTGRAGKSGQALSFITSQDSGKWNYLSRKLRIDTIAKIKVNPK